MMSGVETSNKQTFQILIDSLQWNRRMTLRLLDKVAEQADPAAVLKYRPGPGRAHIGWQLMHIAITEEMFASERLMPEKTGAFQELWPRYRGGSTPDDNVPTVEEIRQVLNESREHLVATLGEFNDSQLGDIPPAFAERGWTMRDVLNVLLWHEPHHQGQAHITLNLYLAEQNSAK